MAERRATRNLPGVSMPGPRDLRLAVRHHAGALAGPARASLRVTVVRPLITDAAPPDDAVRGRDGREERKGDGLLGGGPQVVIGNGA